MSGDLRERALEFFNKAYYQHEHGLFQDSLKNYLLSLDIQEKLAAKQVVPLKFPSLNALIIFRI
jgi:hypothetical protein